MKACWFLVFCWVVRALAEGPVPGPEAVAPRPVDGAIYDPDPRHPWNRLYAAFYQREVEVLEKSPPRPAESELLDPPLGVHPRFLLDDEPFARCNAVLDEFLAARGEKAIADPLKRALLQRDLWAVFDLLQAKSDGGGRNFGDSPEAFTPAHEEHRATLSRKVARIIAALALPRAQLEALPHNYAQAVKSGVFPAAPADQRQADYLPADLFAEKSPWLEASLGDETTRHTAAVSGRSVFRIFYRPPTDPEGAAKFADWVLEIPKVGAEEDDPSGRKWKALTLRLPVGSQFLLLREMIALDDQGQLVATHLVESVQLRVYRHAPPPERAGQPGRLDAPDYDVQLFEEFDLDRRRLFRGETGGLHPVGGGVPRPFGYTALGLLAVNREGVSLPLEPFPQNCFNCHVGARARGERPPTPLNIQSLSRSPKLRPPPWGDTTAQTALRWKKEQKNFLRLGELAAEP